MVKHVKLFENWAEENVKLPEYLDPNRHMIGDTYTLYHPSIRDMINNDMIDFSWWVHEQDHWDEDSNKLLVNFKSFSDYDFWKNNYDEIRINQFLCQYKLEDCFGIPNADNLWLSSNNIKSLKGLEDKQYSKILLRNMPLENLKYLPKKKIELVELHSLSLISLYSDADIEYFMPELQNYCYNELIEEEYNNQSWKKPRDLLFHAYHFCRHENRFYNIEFDEQNGITNKYETQTCSINPWINIYEDPNEVENFDFLFVSFYFNSENFRTKAKEYIKNLDITSLDRRDLW